MTSLELDTALQEHKVVDDQKLEEGKITAKDVRELYDPEPEFLRAKTLTLDEACELGYECAKHWERDSAAPDKTSEVQQPPKESTKEEPKKCEDVGDQKKVSESSAPALATLPRPDDVLKSVLPIAPEEQRGPSSRGRGRGRGKGKGRGRGRGTKKVDSDEEGESQEGEKDEIQDDAGQEDDGMVPHVSKPSPPTDLDPKPKRKTRSSRKKSAAEPSAPSAASALEMPAGLKRKRTLKYNKDLKAEGTKKATPRTSKSKVPPKSLKKSKAEKACKEGAAGEADMDASEKKSKVPPKSPKKSKAKKAGKEGVAGDVDMDAAEKKKLYSRKSSAYHVAKRSALKMGKTKEEALALAKLAPRLAYPSKAHFNLTRLTPFACNCPSLMKLRHTRTRSSCWMLAATERGLAVRSRLWGVD